MDIYSTNSLKEKLRLLDETGICLEPEELEIYSFDTTDRTVFLDIENERIRKDGR